MRIEVYGTLGSGKTTLVEAFAAVSGFKPVFEPVEAHPFLKAFYKDPATFGFEKALHFATDYIHEIKATKGSATIFDAGIGLHKSYTDLMKVSNAERAAFDAVYKVAEQIGTPDLIVHLDYSADDILARIKQRGRAFESGIDRKFIEDLNLALRRNVAKLAKDTPVVTIKAGEYDFVNNLNDAHRLKAQLGRQMLL